MSAASAPLRAPASLNYAHAGELDDRAPLWSPWLYPTGARLRAITDGITAELLRHEQAADMRKRDRRPHDLDVFQRTVVSLIAQTVYELLRGAGPVRLSISERVLARRSRYLSDLHSKQLPHIVRLLSSPELGYLTFKPGERETPFSDGRQSRIAAGPALVDLLELVEGVTLDDIARAEGEELLLLRCDKATEKEVGRVELQEYDDTELTAQYRAEVRELNGWLAAADVQYIGQDDLVDPRKRHMQRRFTRGDDTFGNGGRLYGGFWIPLNKGARLADVRINGSPVVEIDFTATFLQLAYAYVCTQPPEGDLYCIPFPTAVPRELIKSAISARLNGANGWPKDAREDFPEVTKALPWRRFVECVKAAHPALAAVLDMDIGQRFTFTESEILIDALLALKRQGIVALPVHDCIVVAESDEAAGVTAMLNAFKFHARNTGQLKVKRAAPVILTAAAYERGCAEAANF